MKSLWQIYVSTAKMLLGVHHNDSGFVKDLKSYFTDQERKELHPMILNAKIDKPGTCWPSFYAAFGSVSYDSDARRMSYYHEAILSAFSV